MPRTKAPAVTEKNTKQEILDAYRHLMAEVARESGEEDILTSEERTALDAAAKETVEKITKDLSTLKLSLNQTIADLTDRLTAEAERLTTLQKAIAAAGKELDQTQKVKVTAGMLYRMVELQKQKEDDFEKETGRTRVAWELEQKEHDEKIKRERARDEEEYGYERALAKKRDEEEREAEARQFERELAEKKDEQARLLKELEELRRNVAQAPAEVDRAVKDAVTKALAEAKREAETAAILTKQKADSELRVAELKIESLQETLKTQTEEISRLNRELAEATRQVKDIAVSVVEGQRKEATPSVAKT